MGDSTHAGTTVAHCKHDADQIDEYIGRGQGGVTLADEELPGTRGWLGNPYGLDDHTRMESLRQYEADLMRRLVKDDGFRSAVASLSGQTLGCFCQEADESLPLCHGNVIAKWADKLANRDDQTVIIVAGSRSLHDDYHDQVANSSLPWPAVVGRAVRDMGLSNAEIDHLIHGDCDGSPDKWGEAYAEAAESISMEAVEPKWDAYGKAAGYIRNCEMALEAHAAGDAHLLAFWSEDRDDSPGTGHMIDIAEELGIPTQVFNLNDTDTRNDLFPGLIDGRRLPTTVMSDLGIA